MGGAAGVDQQTGPERPGGTPRAERMTIDPRSPVVVGVGQVSQHVEAAVARSPIDLLTDAARLADADAAARRSLLDDIGVVAISAIGSWRYADPGALLARRLGVAPRATAVS